MKQSDPKSGSDPTEQVDMDYPEQLKAKARGFFAKGAEVAYTLNYDYAIELYLDGISFWPNCVEEGHKPLYEIARRRKAADGKKSGFGDGSKYKKASGKNPKDAMLKEEYLLSKDPANQSHMIGMIKAAVKSEYQQSGIWMADILFDNNLHHDKPSFNTYVFLRDMYAELNVYTRALRACQLAMQIKPKDAEMQDSVRDLSAQATLQEGKYDDESDFRSSIKDRESQEKLQSQGAVVRSENVLKDAIRQAREEYDAEPKVPGKIDKLATSLCDTEDEKNEDEAISILEKAFADLGQFRHKQRGGEIRIKQYVRRVRRLQRQFKKDPENKELAQKTAQANGKLLEVELDHYQLCVENYPTDLRMKYEYGKRLMMAKKYDEAIPFFQEARSDPRHRIAALSGIGGCFFYKEWYADAEETFEQALESLEDKGSAVAKELIYNLGRTCEMDGHEGKALDHYRKVAQIDFNYRDARKRVDALRQKQRENKTG